jgi:hypothetical protein
MKALLTNLLKSGKFLFILTNSHYEYLNLTMTATLGKQWEEFFDLIICNAQKPLFTKSRRPFYELDKKSPDLKGTEIFDCEMLEHSQSKVFLEGNAILLTYFLQNHIKK